MSNAKLNQCTYREQFVPLRTFEAHRSDATNYFQMPSVLIDDRPVQDSGHGPNQEDTMGFERAHRSFFIGVTGWQGLI
ncbi:hypothetical protein PSCICN_22760 [Pseudomonas cichorii]|nr:hypothetical protein PSCICN_22760 [Pseudomonas cichorii]